MGGYQCERERLIGCLLSRDPTHNLDMCPEPGYQTCSLLVCRMIFQPNEQPGQSQLIQVALSYSSHIVVENDIVSSCASQVKQNLDKLVEFISIYIEPQYPHDMSIHSKWVSKMTVKLPKRT